MTDVQTGSAQRRRMMIYNRRGISNPNRLKTPIDRQISRHQ
jgi:hypothetical protein